MRAFLFPFLACIACSSAPSSLDAPAPALPPSPSTNAASAPLAFEPCSLRSDHDGADAECARVSVPLAWDVPERASIDLFVKRVPARTARRGQLWLLQGGPGGSSMSMEGFAAFMSRKKPDFDVYLFEHRGVGRSTRLGCAAAEDDASAGGFGVDDAEWDGCLRDLRATWGDEGLAGFSRTNAARDLAHLIERTRAHDDAVFVYGVSYGTALALRYLELFPNGVSGVVLDSIVTPDTTFTGFDRRYDDGAHRWLDRCAADPACSDHLGSDPWAKLAKTLDDVKNGHCSSLGSPAVIRSTVRGMLASLLGDVDKRVLFPAVIHRLARCTPDDVRALVHLANTAPSAPSAAQRAGSSALLANIGLSEMWDEPSPSLSSLEDIASAALVSTDLGVRLGRLYARWRRYPHDVNTWPRTSVPLLMLAGGLDALTPLALARQSADEFRGEGQHFVVFPDAPHGVMAATPLVGREGTCAAELLMRFLDDPRAAPDTSCVGEVVPIDFHGSRDLAQRTLGTTDIWD